MWEADGSISATYHIRDATGATRLQVSNEGVVTASVFSGSGDMLHGLNASYISTGTIDFNRLPIATQSTLGAIRGSSTINIDSETGIASVNIGAVMTGGRVLYGDNPAQPTTEPPGLTKDDLWIQYIN